ncbi:hypothetical protein C7S10_00145 [Nocardioides currus]|uniref:DUF4245 domain-containing protein n=1 Tax=Nocardioides currus TaxID=2133958 RepID=A0A2R7Z0R5_9ACTN|nr:hypothetical protein C7S10_00145 [Nocardioides currus]
MSGVSEKPGRYQRSTNGLVGALIVTLLAIGTFVVLRSVSRTDVEVEPEPVDFAAAAEAARGAGFDVVAPPSLPDGWRATTVELVQTDPARWGLGILTDDDTFVGLRQDAASVSDLVEVNIDEDAVEGEPLEIESAIGDTWQTWSDEGGDTGYSIGYDDQNVLVYGSASPEQLQELIGLLER